MGLKTLKGNGTIEWMRGGSGGHRRRFPGAAILPFWGLSSRGRAVLKALPQVRRQTAEQAETRTEPDDRVTPRNHAGRTRRPLRSIGRSVPTPPRRTTSMRSRLTAWTNTSVPSRRLAPTGRVIRPIGSTPTIRCRHCGICGSLPNSARSDIVARGAGFPAAGTGCSSGDGEPVPSNFT